MSRQRMILFSIAITFAGGLLLGSQPAAQSSQASSGPDAKELQQVVDKAVAFLKSAQNSNGTFSNTLFIPGVTALVEAALVKHGVGPQEPVVAKGLKYLESKVKPDGGIYDKGLANYITAVAILAFKESNQNGKYDTVIKNAGDFSKKIQHEEDGPYHGGFSYDKKKGGADLSNSGFAIDALLAAGLSKDDPAIKRAIEFVGRCQNLPGETNNLAFAKKTTEDDKGGFTYDPGARDESLYKSPNGGLRSVGGMTYTGLKSFLYAGVAKDDPRVKAAVGWVRRHYTLEENPGMGNKGLYYYYHTFAKAMDALGENPFVDAKGTKHDWKAELFQALRSKQQENGSWRNVGDRTFGEDSPELATAFALLSMSYCKVEKR